MSSDAEYILSGLRREYEALSNDVFTLKQDVYHLSESLKREVDFTHKLINSLRAIADSENPDRLINELMDEFTAMRGHQ